jgi:hypothetical protein
VNVRFKINSSAFLSVHTGHYNVLTSKRQHAPPVTAKNSGHAQTSAENSMTAVSDVPDVTGSKMAVGTGHRLSLRARVLD